MLRAVWSFLLIPVLGFSSFFNWGETPLSDKAEKAKAQLEDLGPKIEQALKDYNVPGIAVGVVVDGHVVWTKGFGCRDLASCSTVTGDTVFPIASCTKAFTSCALGILKERGLLDWDDRVIDVLPQFRLMDEYATHHATFRDLLSHRTGLSRHDFMIYNSNVAREEIVRRMRYLEPVSTFRERCNYNSVTYVAAGLALEKMTGKTWEQFIKAELFKPLGMSSTSTTIEELERLSNIAYPYVEREGKLKRIPFRSFDNVGPTASINSNVADLSHWIQMMLARGIYDGTRIVSPTTIQEMHSPQVVNGGYPENSEVILDSYGLGWAISSYRGHYCVGHDGGVDGFTSAIAMLPNEGIGVVTLSNRNLNGLAQVVVREVLDRVLGLPFRDVWIQFGMEKIQRAKQEAKAVEDSFRKIGNPSHELEHYTGEYFHPGYGTLFVEENGGKLQVVFNGITYVLGHWHYDVFRIVEELEEILLSRKGEKVSFRHNLQGDIEEVSVPFDVATSPIAFKKKSREQTLDYFRQFVGTYQYYYTSIDILIKNQRLFAAIPGYPTCELLPFGENEFQIKEKAGYLVRFPKNAAGKIDEALLVPPFGGTFSATRLN